MQAAGNSFILISLGYVDIRRYYDMCTALMMRKSFVEYNLCSSTKVMENACRRLPIQLAKTVRFRMSQLGELIWRMPDLKGRYSFV